jgi:hypothetical protein
MSLDTGEQKRVAGPPVHSRPRQVAGKRHEDAPRPRRSRRLYILLALVIIVGFLVGLGVPIHP